MDQHHVVTEVFLQARIARLGSGQVVGTLQTIAEVRNQVFTTDAPDISESLRLIRQFRVLSGNEQ